MGENRVFLLPQFLKPDFFRKPRPKLVWKYPIWTETKLRQNFVFLNLIDILQWKQDTIVTKWRHSTIGYKECNGVNLINFHIFLIIKTVQSAIQTTYHFCNHTKQSDDERK